MTEDEISRQVARVRALLEAETAEPPRHLAFDELAAFVDGHASADAATHIASCEVCRAEADDLLPLVRRAATRWWWAVAIAAAVVIALITLLVRSAEQAVPTEPVRVVRRTTPPPAVMPPPELPRYAKPEWQQLIDETLAAKRLPFPNDLDALRGDAGTLRGADDPPAAELSPAGIVIDETRPQFTWPRVSGATYVVSIFEGETPVASSGPVEAPRWRPRKPLGRGRTYTWQVDAGSHFFPMPPAPPARFRIVSERDREDLELAKREHPDDHLLLAVLSAKAGLVDDAKRELADSRDPRAATLPR